MDYFAQAAAYLRPSVELVAKLSSAIPVWMMMVMADKHLLGLPLLGGSVWYSPRIPPRFTIGAKPSGDHPAAGSEPSQQSTSNEPSSTKHGFADIATLFAQPSPSPLSVANSLSLPSPSPLSIANSLSLPCSSTTALTIFTPLEVHDPLPISTGWYESGDVFIWAFMVLLLTIIGALINDDWSWFGGQQASEVPQVRHTHDIGMQSEGLKMKDSLIYWEFIPIYFPETKEKSKDDEGPTEPTTHTCIKCAEVVKEIGEDKTLGGTVEGIIADATFTEKKAENRDEDDTKVGSEAKEASRPATHACVEYPEVVEEMGEDKSLEKGVGEITADATLTEKKSDNRDEGDTKLGSEAKEALGSTTHACVECAEVVKETEDKSLGEKVGGIVANATFTGQKAENRDADDTKTESEAKERVGKKDMEENSKVDIKEEGCSETGNNVENSGSEGSLATGDGGKKKKKRRVRQNAKKRAAKKTAAEESSKEAGETPNTLLQDQTKLVSKEEKSEVVKPEASDMLAITMPKSKDTAPPDVPATVAKAGAYSLKEIDLREATVVVSDTLKKISLPPRPPTPQPKESCAPVGLPSRPIFTGLPTANCSGAPTTPPGAPAHMTRPKGTVPPLMPHHKSYGAGQSSGQSSLPRFNVPMKVFEFDQLSRPSAFKFGSDPKPLGENLPSKLFSNGAFDMSPPTRHNNGPVPLNAGPTIASDQTRSSVLQNIPTLSGPFTGFGNPGAGVAPQRSDAHPKSRIPAPLRSVSSSKVVLGRKC